MKTAADYLRDQLGSEPTNFLSYGQALAAVQAAIDHYDPLPGSTEILYRVKEAPRPNVFPPACPRCLQRGAECLCEQPPF